MGTLGKQACVMLLVAGFVTSDLTAQNSSSELTPGELQRSSLHLPSYMPLPALVSYQGMLPIHQELSIEWSAGFSNSSGPVFSLTGRKQKLPGALQKVRLTLGNSGLVVVAATCSGEIRGLAIPAASSPGSQFTVLLPDDPRICGIHFLRRELKSGSRALVQVGVINLQPGTAIKIKPQGM